MFPSPFEQLLTLSLDLSGGHGDDASQVHQLLHSIHKLTSLSLRVPTCDLDACRIQGLGYDYHFPNLTSFSLHAWLDARSGLADFLLRHPSITTLDLDIDSYDKRSIRVAASGLPHLRALAVGHTSQSHHLLSALLSSTASRQITHISLDALYQKTLPILASAGPYLHCLELSTYHVDEWREDPKKLPLRELLPSLPELVEFALDCPTGNTSCHPAPIDVNDLVCQPFRLL